MARHSKWWVLMSVGIGAFMSALDGSIVNTILPVMQEQLGSNVATIQWVVMIYLLVVSCLLLPFGRLGDLKGHRRVYSWGFTIFIVSSMLCGLAWSASALIAARAIQALGAAMLFASSPAILTHHFPAQQRGQALGLQATMTYLGLTTGPALGGWMAQSLGWRSVFYINLPVGTVALACCMVFIPRDQPQGRREPFDRLGASLFMISLVALLLGLSRGHDWGWTAPATWALLGGSIVLMAAFLAVEHRSPHPMLDLGLFRQGLFAATTASALLNYMCVYSISFLLPFYLVKGRGLSPGRAGLILSAQPLVMAVAAPISGTLSDRIGSRWLSTIGMALLASGVFMLSRLGAQTPLTHAIWGLAVAGLGTGIFIAPNNSDLMGSAPRQRQGIAAGILATARNTGMVLGVALAGAILTTSLAYGDDNALYRGISIGFMAASGIGLGGCILSALRPAGAAKPTG